jgi:hypothetical protein
MGAGTAMVGHLADGTVMVVGTTMGALMGAGTATVGLLVDGTAIV